MTISIAELQALEQLAYLDSTAEGPEALLHEINEIMDMVQQLQNRPTDGVAPLFHPLDTQAYSREDAVTESSCIDSLAVIAPQFDQGLFLVPKTIPTPTKPGN